MTDNTVKDNKGNSTDVYANNITLLADSYIYSLSPGDTNTDKANRNSMIKKIPIFKGMLKYIYNNLFKITDKDIIYNNKNSNIDYEDIDSLNNIWDIYTMLCYKYCQNPTLLNFSLMCGISMDCFNDWKNNNSRSGGELSSLHCQSVKRWLKECESAAYDVALSGNPGGMFILKANYGYAETAPVQTHDPNTRPTFDREQIVQQFGEQALIGGNEADF